MAGAIELKKIRQDIKRLTAHIRPDLRSGLELGEREHLNRLYTRLIPSVYDYPAIAVEELVRAVQLKLPAAEASYLSDRLLNVRRRRDVAVICRDEEDVILPLRPGFDPRQVPLAAVWTDGGFYTAKERGSANRGRLRQLGLRDGLAGYASYRILMLNPTTGRASFAHGPDEIKVSSSYEAEAVAVELALQALIAHLEAARHLPPVDLFHVALFSDCQSLIEAIRNPPTSSENEAAGPVLERIRQLTVLLAGVHPSWEPRRQIKRRLGH